MTQAVIKMPCTDGNCKHQHEMLVNLEELGVKAQTEIPPSASITKLPEIEKHEHIYEPMKTDPHEEMAKNLPLGQNFAKCKDGHCGKVVKNPKGITTKFKTCPNCERNTVPTSKKYCPYCKKTFTEDDDIEEDDISDKIEEDEEE